MWVYEKQTHTYRQEKKKTERRLIFSNLSLGNMRYYERLYCSFKTKDVAMLVNIHFSPNTVWHRANKIFELGLNPSLAIWGNPGCFPGGLEDKASTHNTGDPGSIPG